MNLMRFPIIAAILLNTTFAIGMPQSQFVGNWQTPINRITHRSSITVKLREQQQSLGGSIVLVNPDTSEIELPILNLRVTHNAIEFETHDKEATFYWTLTVQKHDRGLLHGSCREMLIDERVQRQH